MTDQEISSSAGNSWQFHEKEYVALREELLALSREQRFFERAAVIGPVAAYSWLATKGTNFSEQPMYVIAWWLPALLMLFHFRRYWRTRREVLRTACYLREVEKQFAHPPLLGWETYYAKLVGRKRRPLPFGDWVFWFVLLGGWVFISSAATYQSIKIDTIRSLILNFAP